MMLSRHKTFAALFLAACVLTKASADSLSDWAGDYSGQLLFGGFGGTWGNSGAMSFSITCEGGLIVNGLIATDFSYNGGGALTWTMPDSPGSVAITLSETITSSYHFRDTIVFPSNTCTGGCFTGSFINNVGGGALDFRGTRNVSGGCGGDPHFKLWSGKWFDFHGICDLVLVHAKAFANGLGLRVHIRTKERYGYSFIETTAIQIGQDVLEVGSFGQFFLNGVEAADLPTTMGNAYSVTHHQENKKKHSFVVQIGEKEAIKVTTLKDMVTVMVENATHATFGSSVGLMGSFGEGKKMARDGVSVLEDNNAFGQEWQVTEDEPYMFEGVPNVPQLPAKCHIPVPKTSRRLGESVATEAAEKACARYGEAEKRDMCVFDVMAMGDLEVAEIHGAF